MKSVEITPVEIHLTRRAVLRSGAHAALGTALSLGTLNDYTEEEKKVTKAVYAKFPHPPTRGDINNAKKEISVYETVTSLAGRQKIESSITQQIDADRVADAYQIVDEPEAKQKYQDQVTSVREIVDLAIFFGGIAGMVKGAFGMAINGKILEDKNAALNKP